MLPPQSDHQSECLLHGLFLGCVSRGLLGFSHEDIIDFDIGAHGPPHSCRVYPCMILYTFGPRPATPQSGRSLCCRQAYIRARPVRNVGWRGTCCGNRARSLKRSPDRRRIGARSLLRGTQCRGGLVSGTREILKFFLLPLSQAHSGASTVLVDELDACGFKLLSKRSAVTADPCAAIAPGFCLSALKTVGRETC